MERRSGVGHPARAVRDRRNGLRGRGALPLRCRTEKFLTFFPVFVLLWVQLFVFHLDYLLPVAIVGMFGIMWTLFLLADRLSFTRKCSKVFRTYPLEFRTPVEKIGMESTHTLFLRFGDQGGAPFTLRAKHALGRRRWPVGITDGVWFMRRRALRRRDHRAGQR